MLDVTVIGNGNAFGENQKFHTCFLCKTNETTFLLDCGATSIYNLEKHQVDFSQLDAVIVSHFHGDHYGGIPFLLLNAHFLLNRTKPLTIIGPPGIEKQVAGLLDVCYPGVREGLTGFEIHFLEFSETPTQLNELKVAGLPVVHAPKSLPHGVRIVGERTLAFSGDTEWTPNLIPLSDDADLFICECNNYNANVNGHLSYHMILEKLSLLQSKRMILTHMGTDMYENQDHLILELSQQDKTYHL